MDTMLKKENIKIINKVKDWKEAISVSVMPLVNHGYVEARYINEIIKNTEQFGPYYVLMPNVALVHASPDQGVIKKQLAITVLKNPIKFLDSNYEVRLIIVLAATDSTSHMTTLSKLANILKDEKLVEKIYNSETVEEIHSYFIV